MRDAIVISVALCVLAAAHGAPLEGQAMGEELFRTTCAACHTTGTDRLVGPGLQGVEDRRDHEWLVSFITEPDRMIAEGDTIATRLLAEYIVPMPNLGTTRAQAESILDYIASANEAPTGETSGTPVAQAPATEEQVLLGQALFQGHTRLANGGPTCNSCHEVTHDAVIGGGILARELTTVFSRLGGPGVRAIIGSPPFPVMQKAYEDRPLTEEEVAGLVAFLERADAEQELHQPRDYGIKLFGFGVVGAALLLGLYSLAWSGRKRGSVNQEIFDRQISSI
ncbi:MAG: cytochrome c [Gemmatimonadetes bacterium]|nr:cytochrome c [Gemmatimonadota bacterium]